MEEKENKQKKYDETNLVRIEGKGRTREFICMEYTDLIESGFNLTVEEVTAYLRCTYQHVTDKIVPEVQHIRITEAAKIMLLRYAAEYNIDERISLLYMKRILFEKTDFQRYICEHAKKIVAYHRFYETDFSPEVINYIKAKLASYNANSKGRNLSIEDYMQRVMNTFLWEKFKNQPLMIPFNESFPATLYSQKDLMELFGLTYKVEFYRKIDSLGVNKIKIGNMIRYRKEEIVEPFLAYMYITAFQRLKERVGERYIITVIQERALEMLD